MPPPVPPEVAEVLSGYTVAMRKALLALRALIWEVAHATEGAGELTETLKWGQPSYLTERPKTGTTIRIDRHAQHAYALYVHCQTTLVEEFRARFGDRLTYEGDRAIVFELGQRLPRREVRACIEAALLYHRRRRA